MSRFTLDIPFDHFQFTLIHGPNTPYPYAILFFAASDFTFTSRHIHNRVLFLLCLSLIPSGAISLLFSSSIVGTDWCGALILQCPIFLPFHTVQGSSQGKNAEVVCHSLLQWTTFCQKSPPWQSWVALHGLAHCFIELDKAIIHVISLVSFLWLWFSLCLLSDGWGYEACGSFPSDGREYNHKDYLIDWCPSKKRKRHQWALSLCQRREEGPCENTVRGSCL